MRAEDKKILFFILKYMTDFFSVNLSFFFSSLFIYNFTLEEHFNSFSELIIIFSVLIIVLMGILKLYGAEDNKRIDLLSKISTVLFIFFFLVSSFNLIVPSYDYSWPLLFLFYILTTIFIISSRLIIFRFEKKSATAQNVAVVGGTKEVEKLIAKIQAKSNDYNLKTVIVNKHEESLEQDLSNEVDTYFGFKWLEPTVDRLENTDILLIAYNNLDNRIKARLFNLKTSSKIKIYILPPSYNPNFFDPDLTH